MFSNIIQKGFGQKLKSKRKDLKNDKSKLTKTESWLCKFYYISLDCTFNDLSLSLIRVYSGPC